MPATLAGIGCWLIIGHWMLRRLGPGRGGLAANRVMEVRGPNFLQHNFQPGFKIALHQKDLGIALSAGRDRSCTY